MVDGQNTEYQSIFKFMGQKTASRILNADIF